MAVGIIARDMLAGMVEARAGLTCVINGKDRYNRLPGTCYGVSDSQSGPEAGEGFDSQQALVRAGLLSPNMPMPIAMMSLMPGREVAVSGRMLYATERLAAEATNCN